MRRRAGHEVEALPAQGYPTGPRRRRSLKDLEAAWPEARRSAARHHLLATLGRIAVDLLGFYSVVSLLVYLVRGLAFPWTSTPSPED